jgi:hypothetical protein
MQLRAPACIKMGARFAETDQYIGPSVASAVRDFDYLFFVDRDSSLGSWLSSEEA